MDNKVETPRLRLKTSIDFSKVDPHCKNCAGSGYSGVAQIENPEKKGELISVNVVCRCVSRSGGVTPDALDKILSDAIEQLESGEFGKILAGDIMRLNPDARKRSIEVLKGQLQDETKDARVLKSITEALKILGEEN